MFDELIKLAKILKPTNSEKSLVFGLVLQMDPFHNDIKHGWKMIHEMWLAPQ
jgi:hypothetical protein